ncbi:MAG: hypothetical protein SCM96_11770 [Acidobacteriota bacterium]|nr:hypothetical protein [Acidobacteriota bacterium]
MRLKSLNRINRPNARKVVRALLVVFYLLSVALWFKDSFSFLKGWPLSPLFGIVPLILLTVLRLVLREPGKKTRLFPFKRRDAAVLILILIAATLVRVPYLSHSFGLMDSDEAIPALAGKHTAEGGRPALYYYGAFFQGSFPQHYYALMFFLFGYSVFMAKLSAFLAFLAFVGVHYIFLKKIFGFLPAAAMSAFFILPIPDLVTAGFDIGSGFPVVLLFGSLIFLLTHAVVFEKSSHWLPALGFLAGLAFWTHQISVIYIATAGLFLAPVLKLQWKKYGALAFHFALGTFPLILNEIYRKFILAKFLFPEGSGRTDFSHVRRYKDLLLSLLTDGRGVLPWIVLVLLLAGSAVLIVLSLTNKKLRPALLFVVYAAVFSVAYLFSDFGHTGVIRYMYILYMVFPVLLAGAFLPFGKKIAAPALAVLLAVLFFAGNGEHSRNFRAAVKDKHVLLARTVAAMEETGEKFWMAEYWISYLLTACSREKVVVASSTIQRYYPYKLYYDSGENSNWVINRDIPQTVTLAGDLTDLLDSLGIPYGFREVETIALFHGIGSYLYPRFPFADPQKTRPDIELEKTRVSDGLLELLFVKKNDVPSGGYRIHIDIPDYFSRFFSLPAGERFSLTVPYPGQREFAVRYRLAYAGLEIPGTEREKACVLSADDLRRPRSAVVYLAGIGPRRDIEGWPMYALRKSAALEVQTGAGPAGRMTIHLHSPFQFSHPFWYGDYSQNVTVFVNGIPHMDRPLRDGVNVLRFDITRAPFRPGANRIDLDFRYAMVFSIHDLWKTAAYLEAVNFE